MRGTQETIYYISERNVNRIFSGTLVFSPQIYKDRSYIFKSLLINFSSISRRRIRTDPKNADQSILIRIN